MEQSYRSYSEVFEDYHGVITPASTGVADKGLNLLAVLSFVQFGLTWVYHLYHCLYLLGKITYH